MVFKVGDRIAHPLHGAGVISGIVRRTVNGAEREYYQLKIPAGDMMVLIPTESCEEIGVRPIVDKAAADRIFRSIPGIEINITQNWNKRYRENMSKLRSGDLLEVAEVIKSLMYRDCERGLSTGERRMLHTAKQILLSEMVLSQGGTYEEAETRLFRALN